jgi:hypothetical protein
MECQLCSDDGENEPHVILNWEIQDLWFVVDSW